MEGAQPDETAGATAKPDEQPSVWFAFFNEIGIVAQLSRARLERVLPEGLLAPQFNVLNHLVRLGDGRAPSRIAAAFQVSRATMTNTLSRLEARGLIALDADPGDGRGKLVRLTPAGRALHGTAMRAVSPAFADLAAAIDVGDPAAALPVLRRVRAFLDANRGGSAAREDGT